MDLPPIRANNLHVSPLILDLDLFLFVNPWDPPQDNIYK